MSGATCPPPRRARIERDTAETQIRVEIDLDGRGDYKIETGIPFFDHMLESLTRHAAFDLQLHAVGDLAVDLHHTVEDVGIALGAALRQALEAGDSIRRFGCFSLPMAEARADIALDLSNRPYLVYRVELANSRIGSFDTSLVEDFLQAFSQHGGIDLHVELRYGKSPHHAVEAIFKGLARALRTALEPDPRLTGPPSVKGSL